MTLIARGAEAELILNDTGMVTKFRRPKDYRLEVIDLSLRKRRTKSEFNILKKLSLDLNVPTVDNLAEASFDMEYIDGNRVRDELNAETAKKLCEKIGAIVGKIHGKGIIHGDLTTSNFILKQGTVYTIDFGLSFYSEKYEDRAVDIHLFYQALKSSHCEIAEKCFDSFTRGYKKVFTEYKTVYDRFLKVEERGRNKTK
ncbi:Kae1-associated serine/threonine protein kinase [Candidatus Woesearchaeota archaeon]|nr:Kae1-associated serine/threonine protein kinase [Candidatus Woesearchaeota archaeon]